MSTESSEPPIEHSRPKANLGRPSAAIVYTFLVFVVSQILAAFIVELIAAVALNRSPSVPVTTYSAVAQFFYILLAEAMAIGSVLLILKHRKISPRKIGWGRRLMLKDFTGALVGYCVFIVVLVLATVLLTALLPGFNTNQSQDVGFNTITSASDHWLAFISLVILPPLGEEFLMRGYLYTTLRSRWNFVPAMLVTSVLFGAAHLLTGDSGLLWSAGVDTFVLSIILVYLREKTGALYAGMMVHALNNLVAFGVHFHG